MNRRTIKIKLLSALVTASALVLASSPAAQADGTTRHYRYVSEPAGGAAVAGQPKPVRVFAAGSTITVSIDDAVNPDNLTVGLVVHSGGARKFFGCVSPGRALTISGLNSRDSVALEVGEGTPYLLVLPGGCTGKSTTGILTMAGIR